MKDLIPVNGFECPYCNKFYKTRQWGEPHVRHCWDNPNREPKPGEITTSNTVYRATEPWHPGAAGYCYIENEWRKVPGFDSRASAFGDDHWPVITCPGTGTRATYDYPGDPDREAAFDRLTKEERIQYWDALIEQYGEQEDRQQ